MRYKPTAKFASVYDYVSSRDKRSASAEPHYDPYYYYYPPPPPPPPRPIRPVRRAVRRRRVFG